MKKFLLKIALFFAIVAIVDIAFGKVLWHLQSTKAGSGTGIEYYICEKGEEDILIMGSSRASHHYVADIIERGLGMDCINGGQDGYGIVLQYGRWIMLSKRHVPKLIVYDVEPFFDLNEGDNMRYIDRLRPFAMDKDVYRYIVGLFPLEKLKLISYMYRYNGRFLEIIGSCFRSANPYKGYRPLYGHIRKEMISADTDSHPASVPVDEVKLSLLRDLVADVLESGSKIVLVYSPSWKSHGISNKYEIEKIANEYGIPFLDYSQSYLTKNPDYFADSVHLNDEGAHAFTEDLIGKLKSLI